MTVITATTAEDMRVHVVAHCLSRASLLVAQSRGCADKIRYDLLSRADELATLGEHFAELAINPKP